MDDVAVIGGGVAGLQAALTLGRARRRVAVFDDGKPRNGPAARVHNFLGHAGTSPAALLETGRPMLAEYDVEVVRERVEDVTAVPHGFAVRGHGVFRAIVLATGLTDELPGVPGVRELWGGPVVACPHCHGWEVRDEALAQLGRRGQPERGVQRALLLRQWSDDVILFTDGDDLAPGDRTRLTSAGITVRSSPVSRVEPTGGGVTVRTADGTAVARRAVFTVVRQRQQSDLAARLGCRTDPHTGAVAIDEAGRTSVPGVRAAGTTAIPALLAIGAAGHAASVAVALHADLAGL